MINTLKSAGAAYWRASEDRPKLCDPNSDDIAKCHEDVFVFATFDPT